MIKRLFLIALVLWCGRPLAQAVDAVRDSVTIYFRQGKTNLDPALSGNKAALDRIADSLRTSYADSVLRLKKVHIVGSASPEGGLKLNKWLSEKRAGVLFDYLSRYGSMPDSLKTTDFVGRDWDGLISLVRDDPEVPYREEALALLAEIAAEERGSIPAKGNPLGRVQRLRGGKPYRYMYRNLFPWLRAARLYLDYEMIQNPAVRVSRVPRLAASVPVPPADSVKGLIPINLSQPEKPFYMDLRTNMLYDILAVPNIGAEFYLGSGWSVLADWMYGWWNSDRRHWYWRAYGGGLAVRKWFGGAARKKPLSGHHVGIYGQVFTYDFETGGRGYMGGKPGGTLWNKMNYAAGVEYGYSLPVARRLNIDFTIGLGYWGGTFHEYNPVDGCYVWQSTRQRHWFGPTKAEISLVWLIGRGNHNKEKGGWR